MVKPTDCRMPDLGEGVFAPLLSHYILKVTFHGTGTSSDSSLRAYITSFIRILDKTIYEYDQSRKELQAYIGSANKTILIMKAVSHLETCVNSLRRCLRLIDRMKTFNLGDSDEARLFRRSVQATSHAVPNVRNAIEHMDEKIAGGEVTEGQPIALMISEVGDRASIAGEEILFSDLASTIRKLHAFAVQLCDYRDPTINPGGPTLALSNRPIQRTAFRAAADRHGAMRKEKEMDKNTEIAGKRTIGDWLQLKESLEREIDKDTLWDQAYDFFEERISTRYLQPIEAIEKHSNIEGEGFAISAIICSLIEALETFRQGKVYRRATKGNPLDETKEYFKSQPIFENFLKNREPFKAHFAAGGLASNFYENVRCALLHEAATRNGWKIRIDTSVLVEKRNESLILNRAFFVDAIKQYMRNYKAELLGSLELKKAFMQKLDSICETT